MALSSTPEQPLYVLHQHKARALIPKFFTLVILSAIFYLGILLNISLLNLDAAQETSIQSGSLIFLVAIIVFSMIVALHRSGIPTLFYRNRLVYNDKIILLTEINNTTPRQDLLDKIFKTQTFNFGKNFILRNVPAELQIEQYLQQLKAYSQRSPLLSAGTRQ